MNYITQLNCFWEKVENELNLKPSSIVVYLALLNINNRCGWKSHFRATYGQVLSMSGIANPKTYYSSLVELTNGGYIEYVKGPNQHQSAVFTIIVLNQKTDEHGKSNGIATEKQGESRGNIPKQLNNKPINISFDDFWNLYDKKVGPKDKLEKKWIAFSDEDRQSIIDYVPNYKKSTPDKKYRLNVETFLNNKGWKNEIINLSTPFQAIEPKFVLGAKPVGARNHTN